MGNEATKVAQTSYVDKCENVHKKVCTPVHGAHAKVSAGYGKVHRLGKREAGHYGYAAAGPRCSTQVERVCKKVPVQSHRLVHAPKCTSVPTTSCVDVVKYVTEKSCAEVPRQECSKVPQEHCVQVPHKVARQECSGPVKSSSQVSH